MMTTSVADEGITGVSGSRPAAALTPRERELAGIISAYNEVTERLKESHERLRHAVRLLREELARKNRELARRERLAALGEMAAGVAHEIRNPLGGIALFASMLEADLEDRPKSRELVERISRGVRSLDGIVNEILTFAGHFVPRPVPVDLRALLEESIELVRGSIPASCVRVVEFGSLEQIDLRADPQHLQQALLNLLRNAVEVTGEAGEVRVSVRVKGQDVEIGIADEGPGIEPELMDRIFNPFFTTKDRGTGLGLAIVHRIAEAHGGSVRVANRSEGGAIFTLRLPKQAEPGRCEPETREP